MDQALDILDACLTEAAIETGESRRLFWSHQPCEETDTPSTEDRAWLDAKPVGNELL